MSGITKVICVTSNYPDGQRISGAKLVYDVAPASVTAEVFQVENIPVLAAAVEENTVILTLDDHAPAAALIPAPPRPKHRPGEGGPGPGKPMGGPPRNMPPAVRMPVQVRAAQTAELIAADGSVIPACDYILSSGSEEPVVEDFTQGTFNGLAYNLFTPALEAGKAYPLVLFIHDAGPCGDDPKLTLSQGNGAVSFADPAWQKDHPCYVLAPEIPRRVHLTDDDFTTAPEINDIVAMVDYIADTCAVDKNRIYTTGQSQGCMASCELNILRPELFAASLLVAGQWSPERMAEKCPRNNYWITVSEHDAKAFPGMNAVTEAIAAAGAEVSRFTWDAKAGSEKLEQFAAEAAAVPATCRYTVFSGDSVCPNPEEDCGPGTNHMSTWPVAYSIRGLKEWLFSCSK